VRGWIGGGRFELDALEQRLEVETFRALPDPAKGPKLHGVEHPPDGQSESLSWPKKARRLR